MCISGLVFNFQKNFSCKSKKKFQKILKAVFLKISLSTSSTKISFNQEPSLSTSSTKISINQEPTDIIT